MQIDQEEGGIFETGEAIVLRRAFLLAKQELASALALDESTSSKLAKIIAGVGRRRMISGGELRSKGGAESVAAIARSRFLNAKPE